MPANTFPTATHRGGRGVLIRRSVSEESPNFIHRHGAHLLPAIYSHLQLMNPEVMGVPGGQKGGRGETLSTILSRKEKYKQGLKQDLLHNDVKTKAAKPFRNDLMRGKSRECFNWVLYFARLTKPEQEWHCPSSYNPADL